MRKRQQWMPGGTNRKEPAETCEAYSAIWESSQNLWELAQPLAQQHKKKRTGEFLSKPSARISVPEHINQTLRITPESS